MVFEDHQSDYRRAAWTLCCCVLSLDCIKEEVINRRIKCQGQQVFPLINGNGSELRAGETTRYYWEITLTSLSGSFSLHRLPLSFTSDDTDSSSTVQKKPHNCDVTCIVDVFYQHISSIDNSLFLAPECILWQNKGYRTKVCQRLYCMKYIYVRFQHVMGGRLACGEDNHFEQ